VKVGQTDNKHFQNIGNVFIQWRTKRTDIINIKKQQCSYWGRLYIELQTICIYM